MLTPNASPMRRQDRKAGSEKEQGRGLRYGLGLEVGKERIELDAVVLLKNTQEQRDRLSRQ